MGKRSILKEILCLYAPIIVGSFLMFCRPAEDSIAYIPERNIRIIERPEEQMERLTPNPLEEYLELKPVIPENAPDTKKKNEEQGEKNDKWYEHILDEVKYSNGPTRFAGEIYDNGIVKVLDRDGEQINSVEGLATFYSRREGFHKTATGAQFNDNEFTVAVNERLGYQLPCLVRITNLENDESVEAIANDHGPYKFNRNGKAIKRGRRFIPHEERIVDASPAVAKELGFFEDGKARVRVEYVRQL